MNSDSNVLQRIDESGVAFLTLNCPETHNAFDDKIIKRLDEAIQELGTDARALVLGSVGESFSAGAHLGWMKRMAQYSYADNLDDARALASLLKNLNNFPAPTIARIQGAAFGGAVGLASCCDIAIASTKARFCFSEVKIGLIPSAISPYIVNAIGERASRRYFTTAETFSAEKAMQLGLVSEVVADDQLDTTIERITAAILSNGPEAVVAAKQLALDVAASEFDDDLIEDTCERIANIRVSPEGQEGLAAFLEKRSPKWMSK